MKLSLVVFISTVLAAFTAAADCHDPGTVHSIHGNFTADLLGQPDTRPYTWGNDDTMVKTLTFVVPESCRVQILHLEGDFVAWPILGVTPAGTQAGTLLAISPTTVAASQYADYASDGCMLYIQAVTGGTPVRATFARDLVSGILDSDGKLNFTFADWLNNTGLIIHMEATLEIRFRYVDPPAPATASSLRRVPILQWLKSH